MTVIRPFSPEQERALINMRQRYEAWIDAERALFALPYDLRRKKVGAYEYLYEIDDRSGNGTSLGAWNEDREAQFNAYRVTKADAIAQEHAAQYLLRPAVVTHYVTAERENAADA